MQLVNMYDLMRIIKVSESRSNIQNSAYFSLTFSQVQCKFRRPRDSGVGRGFTLNRFIHAQVTFLGKEMAL
jgi:hypothetical protein